MTRQSHRFTLIELLVVMAVIAILAGMVIGGVGIANRKAAEAKTRALLTQFEIAFDQYKQQYGYFPQQITDNTPIAEVFVKGKIQSPRLHGLEQPNLTAGKEDQSGRYFLDISSLTFVSGILQDAFGNSVYYQCPGKVNTESYDLWTAGVDGKFGDPASSASDLAKPANAQKTDAATVNSDDLTNWKKN